MNTNSSITPRIETHRSKNIGPVIHVLQLNIEGISRPKSEYASKVAIYNSIDLIALQETHTTTDNDLLNRGEIAGFVAVSHIPNRVYGIATYIRSSINDYSVLSESSLNDVFTIVVEICGVVVVNVYKPPSVILMDSPIVAQSGPAVYVGDFNCHHTSWGYNENDRNGDTLHTWADRNNLNLIFDAKDRGTFHSARWRRDYNPDLCFVSSNDRNLPLPASRTVLSNFPNSQHRPVKITIGVTIPLVESIQKPRWNFRKADWKKFQSQVDSNLRWVTPRRFNYERFVGILNAAAKRTIPRGFRKDYVPGWNDNLEQLLKEFEESGDPEISEELLDALNQNRREKWAETTKNVDFTRSSRKAWNVLRKIGSAKNSIARKNKDSPVTPNSIASRLVKISNIVKVSRGRKKFVRSALRVKKKLLTPNQQFSRPFDTTEVDSCIDALHTGKAAGADKIYPEFIKNLGKSARSWLTRFLNDLLATKDIPREFRKTKVVVILKPNKPAEDPSSYRPISLLSVCYKLLERLIYNRIYEAIDSKLPDEQAGFRRKRSCTDQILALTTHIEAGFEKKLKTGVALVDLSSAYDTVWKDGLLLKFIDAVPCSTLASLLNNMLSNRQIKVVMNGERSRTIILNNGLPQGSVLAPLLFNLYTSDMPDTQSRKFGYADDNALGNQHKNPKYIEHTLTNDLAILEKFYRDWRLCPNPDKTEVSFFHLNNREANKQLTVKFCGKSVKFNPNPRYLGYKMDRTQTHKAHLEDVAQKLKSRNNIISKLAGSSWGSDGNTLRTAALGIVYSTAEFCCPVWLRSSHINKVDVQLNACLRTVTGTLKSTPLPWLPVLSNIMPSHI